METQPSVRLVHYYDTQSHQILCGVHGFEQRSTKHARSVNCLACVSLLAERAAPAGEAASTAVHE